jgi:hypothetical protein
LKAPGFNPLTYEVKNRFQTLLSKFNLYRYTEEEELAFPTVKWALDYAAGVALPCLEAGGGAQWVSGFVPQQRTKLIFGTPTDGVGYVDETTAA